MRRKGWNEHEMMVKIVNHKNQWAGDSLEDPTNDGEAWKYLAVHSSKQAKCLYEGNGEEGKKKNEKVEKEKKKRKTKSNKMTIVTNNT